MATMTQPVTRDGFLDGALTLVQPVRGHRAGTDAVFLAAAANPAQGARVLDMGAGVGAAGLCLKWRRPDVSLTLAEIDAETAALARANAEFNGLAAETITCDLLKGPAGLAELGLLANSFDLIITNPPFYAQGTVSITPHEKRAVAHVAGNDFLKVWLKRAAGLLTAKGELVLIHRADALAGILSALSPAFGNIRLLPVHGRPQLAAERILVAATMGRKTPLKILPPIALNTADGSPSELQHRISRHGQALSLDVLSSRPHMQGAD